MAFEDNIIGTDEDEYSGFEEDLLNDKKEQEEEESINNAAILGVKSCTNSN